MIVFADCVCVGSVTVSTCQMVNLLRLLCIFRCYECTRTNKVPIWVLMTPELAKKFWPSILGQTWQWLASADISTNPKPATALSRIEPDPKPTWVPLHFPLFRILGFCLPLQSSSSTKATGDPPPQISAKNSCCGLLKYQSASMMVTSNIAQRWWSIFDSGEVPRSCPLFPAFFSFWNSNWLLLL